MNDCASPESRAQPVLQAHGLQAGRPRATAQLLAVSVCLHRNREFGCRAATAADHKVSTTTRGLLLTLAKGLKQNVLQLAEASPNHPLNHFHLFAYYANELLKCKSE